jgi:hypothetical protein
VDPEQTFQVQPLSFIIKSKITEKFVVFLTVVVAYFVPSAGLIQTALNIIFA